MRQGVKSGGIETFVKRRDDFLARQRQRRREMRRVARELALSEQTEVRSLGVPNVGCVSSLGHEQTIHVMSAEKKKQLISNNDNGFNGFDTTITAAAITPSQSFEQQPAQCDLQVKQSKKRPKQTKNKVERQAGRLAHIEKQQKKRRFYAEQLMRPEWLTTRPAFRSDKWFIIARPDGERCVIAASRGLTVSRNKNGNVLHRWPSELPSGSRKTQGRHDEYTLLDCVYYKPSRTYFIIDLMCWKGRLLYDTDATFRMWWLRTKLKEECPTIHVIRAANKFSISPAFLAPCTRTGLSQVYNPTTIPYDRDGLLFYHKEGFYEAGSTPLVVQWKDGCCSKYVVNTNPALDSHEQRVVLHVTNTGGLVTLDKQHLGQLSREHVAKFGIKPDQFIRFRVGGIQYNAVNGNLVGLMNPQFEKICGPSRVAADTASQIVFQFLARNTPVTIDTIIAGIYEDKAPSFAPAQ